MRNEIIEQIKAKISSAFNGQILTYEPDWTSWTSYPVILLLASSENGTGALGGSSKRELKIDIVIVSRSLTTAISETDKYVLEMIDKIEETFKGLILPLERQVLINIGAIAFDKTYVKSDFYISGASMELNCQFVR
ncbi:MAG: hypothetical protein M1542_07580 [Thermotogae bacterium]|jgi:hypothetical protein|nr:hypothetical protein [Thermotogota bacterium]MCL5033085.1 hypothetical protein [Thermotogota bacterium]